MLDELKDIETLEEVCEWEMMQAPGVFIFSEDGRRVSAIGRSETNVGAYLRSRSFDLKQKYSFYKIEPSYSTLEAFLMHCRLYHKHQVGQHPEPTKDKSNWGCPVLGCKWEEQRKNRIRTAVLRQPELANAY